MSIKVNPIIKYLLLALVIFGANTVQTVTGFAGAMLAMPPTIALLGMNEARMLVNILGLAPCWWVFLRNTDRVNRREMIKMISLMLPFMLVGMMAANTESAGVFLRPYAVVIILTAIFRAYGMLSKRRIFPENTFTKKIRPVIYIAVLVLAGLIHGMFVSGGAFTVIYAGATMPDKDEFRATMSGLWSVLGTIILATDLFNIVSTQSSGVLFDAAVCALPLAAALFIGGVIAKKLSGRIFSAVTVFLLFLSGMSILIK